MWEYDREDKEPDFLDVEDDEFDDEEDDEPEEPEEPQEPEEPKEPEDEDDKYVRVNFTIPKNMRKKVKKYAQKIGVTVSELIRGSLDGIMALGEAGVDLGKQLEEGFEKELGKLKDYEDDIKEGLKEGLKGLESLKDIDFSKFEKLKDFKDIDVDFEDPEFEEKMEEFEEKRAEFEEKMEEFGQKMAEYGEKMAEKIQKNVEKNLYHLKREFPHVPGVEPLRRPNPPRAPRKPREPWPSVRFHKSEKEGLLDPIKKLEKLKELLDNGLITQEDYDKKKSEILEQI
jgi:hypothetical protein